MKSLRTNISQLSLFCYQLCHLSLAQWQIEDTAQEQQRQQTFSRLIK